MSFNLDLQSRCRRRERMASYAAEKVRSMLEPFVLEKLYPPTPTETFPGSGKWKNVYNIQPHQRKLHDRRSISGKTPKHLLFSCVGGETVIGGRPIRDWERDRTAPDYLPTLFGSAVPEVPYLKGKADLYRVRTKSGREVVVTAQHRFLGVDGWDRLENLHAGSLIAADGSWHESLDLEKPTGFQGDYLSGLRPDDGLPRPVEVAARSISRLPRNSGVDSNALAVDNRPSIDDFSHLSDSIHRACAEKLRHASDDNAGFRHLSRKIYQELPVTGLAGIGLSLPELAHLSELMLAQRPPAFHLPEEFVKPVLDGSPIPARLWPDCLASGTLQSLPQDRIRMTDSDGKVVPCTKISERRTYEVPYEPSIEIVLDVEQSPSENVFHGTLKSIHQENIPYDNNTSFWDEIVSIEWERYDKFYDVGVPGAEHYSAGGLYHHNSGVGAGKTLTMCVEMMRLLRTYPGIQIVVVTAFDYYFDEFLMPVWNSVLPEDSPHIKSSNKKSRSIVLTNGSRIRFKAYDDPDKIKGWQAHVIWIEEGSEIGDGNNDKAYAIWNALLMRLRASRPAYPLRTYITQNPKGHNWLWRIFIKDEPTKRQPLADIGQDTIFAYDGAGRPKYYTEWEKVTDSGEIFYTLACPSTSNSFIPDGYIDSMLSQMADDPGLRQRMVEGKFNPVNTLVYDYPIFSERTHVVDYGRFLEYWEIDEIPKWWRVVVGIDVGGSRSPWAVEYYVQTEDGHWVCFDEIYQPNLVYDEICARIKAKSEGFENISYWIDPISSQHKDGATAIKLQEELRYRGIGTNVPKGYNKHGGIARVQNFLRRDHDVPCPYKDDILSEDDDGEPYWENGHAQLYYLTNMPHRVTDRNPKGHSAPGNISEKGVYRWDQTKVRAAKATEEGLSPMMSSKLIDRDDHAQTAEMFFALGVAPITTRTKSESTQRKRQVVDQPNNTPIMYGRQKRNGRR